MHQRGLPAIAEHLVKSFKSGNTAAHSTANLRHVVYTRIVPWLYRAMP